jgi:peroxiredoxin
MRWIKFVAAFAVAVLLTGGAPAGALEVGDKAPDFQLPATTKENLALSEFLGRKHVVLFGFVGAFTPT